MSLSDFTFESPTTDARPTFDVSGHTALVSSMTSIPQDKVGEILRAWAMHLVIHGVLPRRTNPQDICGGCLKKHFKAVDGMKKRKGFFGHELDHLDEWVPFSKEVTLTVLRALMTCLENNGLAPKSVTDAHKEWARSLGDLQESECSEEAS